MGRMAQRDAARVPGVVQLGGTDGRCSHARPSAGCRPVDRHDGRHAFNADSTRLHALRSVLCRPDTINE